MTDVRKIRARFGGSICRRCINRAYHVNLQPSECRYSYPQRCPVCGQERNLVLDVSHTGRWKLLRAEE